MRCVAENSTFVNFDQAPDKYQEPAASQQSSFNAAITSGGKKFPIRSDIELRILPMVALTERRCDA
ncbi:hypothetical protein OA90_02315 [Labrenzia sp. OB1]|nr:hypothetical protein OA90_02315 [Labrenzia sp. OB1]